MQTDSQMSEYTLLYTELVHTFNYCCAECHNVVVGVTGGGADHCGGGGSGVRVVSLGGGGTGETC